MNIADAMDAMAQGYTVTTGEEEDGTSIYYSMTVVGDITAFEVKLKGQELGAIQSSIPLRHLILDWYVVDHREGVDKTYSIMSEYLAEAFPREAPDFQQITTEELIAELTARGVFTEEKKLNYEARKRGEPVQQLPNPNFEASKFRGKVVDGAGFHDPSRPVTAPKEETPPGPPDPPPVKAKFYA